MKFRLVNFRLALFLNTCFQVVILACVPVQHDQVIYVTNINKDEFMAGLILGTEDSIRLLKDSCWMEESRKAFISALLPNFFVEHKIFEQPEMFAVQSVKWNYDGKYLACGASCRYIESRSSYKVVNVLNLETGKVSAFDVPGGWANSVSWSSDDRHLACGSNDKTVRVWDVQTERECRVFSGHENWVNAVAWGPDGWLASASGDATLRIWNFVTGESRVFIGHQACVYAVAWSPNGKHLASCSGDGAIIIWDALSGKIIKKFYGHGKSKHCVAWSPDGRYLASGTNEWIVSIWDVSVGVECIRLKGHKSWVSSVAWSPDGRYLVSASDDETLKIWDIKEKRECRTLRGHKSTIESVAWSQDGGYLASGSWDGTVRVWRRITDLNQSLLILILQYLKKQKRMNDFHDIMTLPCLNKKGGLIRLIPAWFAFNSIEQIYLSNEFCTRCSAKSLPQVFKKLKNIN